MTAFFFITDTRKPLLRGRLNTVDLLIKIGCFGKDKIILSTGKAADLNLFVQGGLLC
jgi:hypothetical protein